MGLSIEYVSFDHMATYVLSIVHDHPRDYRDVINLIDNSSWLVAMEKDFEFAQ